MRRHERLDRAAEHRCVRFSPNCCRSRCPVIEGVELAARCRPAFQVGGDYFDFIPTRPQLLGQAP